MLTPRTWIEISKENLSENIKVFRNIISRKTKLMAVIKANAYGHGFGQVLSIIKDEVDWLGVDSLEEALRIRKSGVKTPVLVMGYTPLNDLINAVKNDISFVVYDKDSIVKALSLSHKNTPKMHIKIETGLNRQGVKTNDALELYKIMSKNKNNIYPEGVSTHFADIEDTLDSSYAEKQLKHFKSTIDYFKCKNKNIMVHCAATAASMLYKKTHLDMIRVGIGIYGLWPSKETKIALKIKNVKFDLKPVLSWKSMIVQVKKVKTGESVGYGRTWYAPRDSLIGIVPVGYSDGYDRGLTNKSHVLIKGKKAPVVGRVAMNMIMVDVTESNGVKVGDNITLIGKENNNEVSADNLAELLNTINYEIVSKINPGILRKII